MSNSIKLVFRTTTTEEQFVENCSSNEFWTLVKESEFKWSLRDQDFNSEASVRWLTEGLTTNVVEIVTAWSGFKYTIAFDEDGGTVIYEGAFGALMEQNLLPAMEVDIDLFAPIFSLKYGEERLVNYAARRFNKGYYIPKVLWGEFNQLPYFYVLEDRGCGIEYMVGRMTNYPEANYLRNSLQFNIETNGNGDPYTYSIRYHNE